MIICGIDVETTSLSIKEARIIQIGCALFDTEFNEITDRFECLMYKEDYPESDPGAFAAHKLPLGLLKKSGKDPRLVLGGVLSFMGSSDFLCGHNLVNFDLPILREELTRSGLAVPNIPVIDTRDHIKYKDGVTSRRLSHVCIDHKIVLDPEESHRALYDVGVMFRVLSKYDINEVVERSKSPMVKLIADAPYEMNKFVKEKRFRWDSISRRWEKVVLLADAPEFVESCAFKVIIDGA